MKPAGRWIEGLTPDTALRDAAAAVVVARTEALCGFLEPALGRGKGGVEAVHKLRVSTRRLDSSLRCFRTWIDDDLFEKARRRLRGLRRSAGAARDRDVVALLLRERFAEADEDTAAALETLLEHIGRDRDAARQRLAERVAKRPPGGLRRLADKVVRRVRELDSTHGEITFRDAAWSVVPGLVERVREAWDADLADLVALHALRIELKRLRYALEVFEPCLGVAFHGEVYPALRDAQDWLGGVNDADSAASITQACLDACADDAVAQGLAEIRDALRADAAESQSGFAREWPRERADGFLRAVAGLLQPPPAPATPPGALPRRFTPETGSAAHNGHNGHASGGGGAQGRRVAVIDVGTNSIRLIVAEAAGDGTYRVIDDEKETTRLGAGLGQTGVMTTAAMQRAAGVIGHMMRIARGYNAQRVRAIGTAVVREAVNRAEFIELVRAAAGIEVEPISAGDEARLAYASAAGAFDISGINAAVIDVGGGSTEIIMAAHGVIDRVYEAPLGAVRLTERFGGAEASSGERFEEMREHARSVLREIIGEPPFTAQMLVGSGGTCTNLATMAMAVDSGALPRDMTPVALRSQVIRRAHVEHLLDRLRRMTVAERVRVAGLTPDRADIIVAGLTLVDAAMELLGVKSMRVHERGIRDGLLRHMIAELREAPVAGDAPDPRRSVARFADSCRYERAHCEHVARLAVQIFDQLAALDPGGEGAWRGGEARLLLEAAGALHDVGYHINYAQHHKHSYHLIIHSDLPGFTARQVAVIANLARYHRGSKPKADHENFAALAEGDRELVRRLAAILRVADGLDRPHTGGVERVDLRIEGGEAWFLIHASREPGVEIWGAQRKAALFEKVFGLTPVFAWSGEQATRPADERQHPERTT